MEIFTGKQFSIFMERSRKHYLDKCKWANGRDYNTEEEVNRSEFYYPNVQYKKYGYYTYEEHTGCYQWTKKKPKVA